MAIVCLDSQLIVWGIKEIVGREQEAMVTRAKTFLKWLDNNGKKVIIPAPLITEILLPVPVESYADVLHVLHKNFRIVPFDEMAAIKCAEFERRKATDETVKQYRKKHGLNKQHLNYVIQLAALAVTRNAECIYSHDPHLPALIGDLIPVKQMPNFASQLGFGF